MTTADFIQLLNNPKSISQKQADALEVIVSEFPYLQAARAIRLKTLYDQHSFRYNLELKKTAAFTTDRSILFDFITSEDFRQKSESHLAEQIWEETELQKNNSIIQISQTTEIIPEASESPETLLDLGSPIDFSVNETHSFEQWLQLTKVQPLGKSLSEGTQIKEKESDKPLSNKMALIDKFISSNPKIIPDKNVPIVTAFEIKPLDNTTLMTETLAKVYLEQKKYQKAIEAYEILILKYPEKSVFFADRIETIKKLQQNNTV